MQHRPSKTNRYLSLQDLEIIKDSNGKLTSKQLSLNLGKSQTTIITAAKKLHVPLAKSYFQIINTNSDQYIR